MWEGYCPTTATTGPVFSNACTENHCGRTVDADKKYLLVRCIHYHMQLSSRQEVRAGFSDKESQLEFSGSRRLPCGSAYSGWQMVNIMNDKYSSSCTMFNNACTEYHCGRKSMATRQKSYMLTVSLTMWNSIWRKTFGLDFFSKQLGQNVFYPIDFHMVSATVVDDMLRFCSASTATTVAVFNRACTL